MTVTPSNNRTSILVPSQLPEFIREDSNNFVQFLQSYYQFLEDKDYRKAIQSNLSVSTAIGPDGVNQNTNIVYLSSTVATSNVLFKSGDKVSIDGHITFVKDQFALSNLSVIPIATNERSVTTNYVYVSNTSNLTLKTFNSDVPISNGSKVVINGVVTSVSNLTNNFFNVTPNVAFNQIEDSVFMYNISAKNTLTLSDMITSNSALWSSLKVSTIAATPYSTSIYVNPPVPTRIVQGDFYIYDKRTFVANNHLMNITKNWTRYFDIDIATTDSQQVTQKLYDNFIKVLPKNLIADKSLIAKHAKEFYRAKGTQRSIQFLLRALYNTESDFYYPQSDILRASDGKWYVEKSIRITNTMSNNVSNTMAESLFVNHQITGKSSGAIALVEGVNIYYKNGVLVTELTVSNSSKPFFSNEDIYTFYQDSLTSGTKYASATIFGGQIVDTQIVYGGTGYLEGMVIPVIPTDNTGNGAKIVVSKVSRGGINRVYVGSNNTIGLPDLGGVGYRVDDFVLITGGGGTGALAGIESVWDNNFYHPNTYNLTSTTIGDVADYLLESYGVDAPNFNIQDTTVIADAVVADSVNYWTYDQTGPAKFVYVIEEGQDYGTSLPNFTVEANTRILNLGILGKMKIVDGGLNYRVNDIIEFINKENYSYGAGATANVRNVAANGMITEVHFLPMHGHFTGGSGYNQDYLPTCNVRSATGNGANIVVTNILGTGGSFTFTTESLGIIKALKILNGGTAYTTPPILDLTGLGDGTAQVVAGSVTGIYKYPGRYISEDGFLSSKNKLENRDYYQSFSYVIKSQSPIAMYKPLLQSLAHPAGTVMYGMYQMVNTANATMNVSQTFNSSNTISISPDGLALYLDSANTIDPFTGVGYEYSIFDDNKQYIFDDSGLITPIHGISIDSSAYYHPTTWVSLADYGYVGQIYNGAAINQETGVLQFDGTNEFAYLPANYLLDLPILTVEAWFAPETLFERGYIVEKGFRNQQYGLLLELSPRKDDTFLTWRANIDGYVKDMVKARSSKYLNLGWNHVAVTYTPGAQVMYINGQFAGANNVVGNMASPPAGITIAASGSVSAKIPDRTYYFAGKIGIVRVYGRVLDVIEIEKNFNRERIRFGL